MGDVARLFDAVERALGSHHLDGEHAVGRTHTAGADLPKAGDWKSGQGSKSLALIVCIDQSQYSIEYHITHSSFVIGQFKLCEPRISNPDLRVLQELHPVTYRVYLDYNNIYESFEAIWAFYFNLIRR